jgi:hypothetical protein
MAFAGHKGHIALMDAAKMTLSAEFHVNETCRDVVLLHNEVN